MDNPVYNLGEYEDKWVALSEPGDVVGVGRDASEAQKAAQQNGYSEPLILKVPSSDYGYIPMYEISLSALSQQEEPRRKHGQANDRDSLISGQQGDQFARSN